MKTLLYFTVVLMLGVANALPKNATNKSRKPVAFIVGGIAVDISEYPFQLSLRSSGSHFCGAAIIHTNWAVTAAHCVKGKKVISLSVLAGSTKRSSGGSIHGVKKIILHPSYNARTNDYDVALLQLSTPLVYSTNVQNIPLVALNTVIPADTNSTTSGWGTMASGANTLPEDLRAVSIPIVSQASCKTAYGQTAITDRMICAGFTAGGKDSCQGDSGGPLIAVLAGVKQLIGLVSWGNGCALPNYPGVYTDLADFRDWIRTNTNNVV